VMKLFLLNKKFDLTEYGAHVERERVLMFTSRLPGRFAVLTGKSLRIKTFLRRCTVGLAYSLASYIVMHEIFAT